jgi:hypothetical protein
VEPLTIPTAVIPSNGTLRPFGVVPGTLEVAWRKQKGIGPVNALSSGEWRRHLESVSDRAGRADNRMVSPKWNCMHSRM